MLKVFNSVDYNSTLLFTNDAPQSKLFENADRKLIKFLREKKISYHNHMLGIDPDAYRQYPEIKKQLNMLALSQDRDGKNFGSIVENKKYPFYGYIFHPEKPSFEWNIHLNVPHDILSIEAASYFINFFVVECSKNNQKFDSYEEFKRRNIYNYPLKYWGDNFDQVYVFYY